MRALAILAAALIIVGGTVAGLLIGANTHKTGATTTRPGCVTTGANEQTCPWPADTGHTVCYWAGPGYESLCSWVPGQ